MSKTDRLIEQMDNEQERMLKAHEQLMDLCKRDSYDEAIHCMIVIDQFQSATMEYMRVVAEWHKELEKLDRPILFLILDDLLHDEDYRIFRYVIGGCIVALALLILASIVFAA